MRKIGFMYFPVVKWYEVARTFGLLDYVRKMTAKKSRKYGKCGLLGICFLCMKYNLYTAMRKIEFVQLLC